MNIITRLEKEADYFETESVIREAFWDVYKPGCDEHLMLHQLRQSVAFIPELDFVACVNNKIVGNIIYSKAIIQNEQGENTVLCMGPLCVLPAYQKKGIGSLLLNLTIEKAKHLGYAAIVIFGNPKYYARFGFKNAKGYNIQTSNGQNFDAFMVLDLSNNRLRNIYGRFFEDKAFQVDAKELEKFELKFPSNEMLKSNELMQKELRRPMMLIVAAHKD